MSDLNNRESVELELEWHRLAQFPPPDEGQWHRASWMRGAMFALGWVIHRRGGELAPSEVARGYFPPVPVPPVPNESPKD